MGRTPAWVFACLVGLQPSAVWARQGIAPGLAPPLLTRPAVGEAESQAAARQPGPSFDALGVSFERIKRDLRVQAPSKTNVPLKLEYYVEVVADAPPFMLFAPDESSFGPVPGTAPSHADMVRHVTPQAFSAPAATLVSIGGRKGSAPKIVGQDVWQMQSRASREAARRKKLQAERQKAIEAERLRQQRLKESVVVSPPK